MESLSQAEAPALGSQTDLAYVICKMISLV